MLTITILANLQSIEELKNIFCKHINEYVQSVQIHETGYACTLKDNSKIYINVPSHANTYEKWQGQLQGMMKFYSNIETNTINVKEPLLVKLQLCNCMYTIEFDTTQNQDRANYLFTNVIYTLKDIQGLMMMPDLSIYDSDYKLILNKEGKSELETYQPTVSADTLYSDKAKPTSEDSNRYQNNHEYLSTLGITTPTHMQLALSSSEVSIRSVEDTATRAVSLFTVGLFSEGILVEKLSYDEVFAFISTLNSKYNAFNYLTPKENAYIQNQNIDEQTCIQFIWRYEGAAILLWALGHIDIPPINQVCDVSLLAQKFNEFTSLQDLIEKSNLRSNEELLIQQDLMMQLHWASIEQRVKNQQPNPNFDPGVVMERHYTLNWLVTTLYGDDFDKIETPA